MRGLALALLLSTWNFDAMAGEAVSYLANEPAIKGYLSLPQATTKQPAVIVIHESRGLTEWVHEQADTLADLGYVALAVDLYRGKKTDDKEPAQELWNGLPREQALADIGRAIAFLRSHPKVSGNIAVIGWSMGAEFALAAALAHPELKAAIVVYGRPVLEPKRLSTLEVPLLGIYGADDRAIPERSVKQFHQSLTELGKRAKIKTYPKLGHGFMNRGYKDTFDPTSTKLAWREIDSFLKSMAR